MQTTMAGTPRFSRMMGVLTLAAAVVLIAASASAQRTDRPAAAPRGEVIVVAFNSTAMISQGEGFPAALEQAFAAREGAGRVVAIDSLNPATIAAAVQTIEDQGTEQTLGGIIELNFQSTPPQSPTIALISVYHEPFPSLPKERIASPEYTFKFGAESAALAVALGAALEQQDSRTSRPFANAEWRPAEQANDQLSAAARRKTVQLVFQSPFPVDQVSPIPLAERIAGAAAIYRTSDECAVMGVVSEPARRHAKLTDMEIRVFRHYHDNKDEYTDEEQQARKDTATSPVAVMRPNAAGLYVISGLEPLTPYTFTMIDTAKPAGAFWRELDSGRFVTASLTGTVRTMPNRLDVYTPLVLPERKPAAAPQNEIATAGQPFDVVIEGATVFDGTRDAPRRVADVAIRGERIAAVGDLKGQPRRDTIAGAGHFLMPGFIDIHSHADSNILTIADAPSHTRQGITTVLGGNCSYSSLGMGAWLRRVEERGAPLNIAMLIGNRPVRERVMGRRKGQPTYDEVYWMKLYVDLAMEEGAFGMSSGLIYAISEEAFTWELAELAKQMKPYGGFYASHIRGETDEVLDAAREAIFIGELAEVPVQISHMKIINKRNWGQMPEYLELIRTARARGLDVLGDQYPWRASGPAGHYQLHRLLVREAINAETPEVVWLKDMPAPYEKYSGRPLTDLLEGEGLTAEELVEKMELTPQSRVYCTYLCLSDEDVRAAMREDFVMVCTDAALVDSGAIASGRVWDEHPRKFRTYPEFFAKYVRDGGVCSWELGVYKSTGLPAQRLGLNDRGVIRPGAYADLVLLDPEKLDPGADFRDQVAPPRGISHVFVNGAPMLTTGELIADRPGRVLYH